MQQQPPDIEALFRPKRFRILPVLVILGLCVFGLWLMNLGPTTPPPRKAPPKAAAPPQEDTVSFMVTLVPSLGWCCVEGSKLSQTSRTGCEAAKGVFFAAEEQARAACPPTAKSGSPKGPGKGA